MKCCMLRNSKLSFLNWVELLEAMQGISVQTISGYLEGLLLLKCSTNVASLFSFRQQNGERENYFNISYKFRVEFEFTNWIPQIAASPVFAPPCSLLSIWLFQNFAACTSLRQLQSSFCILFLSYNRRRIRDFTVEKAYKHSEKRLVIAYWKCLAVQCQVCTEAWKMFVPTVTMVRNNKYYKNWSGPSLLSKN